MTGPDPKLQWEAAQKWERGWWDRNGINSWNEEHKQRLMMPYMGLTLDRWSRIDFGGKSVVDIGGGPTSMLLRGMNVVNPTIIDPLPQPQWVMERYGAAGISYLMLKGEDLSHYQPGQWDEVLLYNCLQHTEDWRLVLANAQKIGKTLRFFEWIKTGVTDGHLHDLQADELRDVLGCGEEVVIRWPDGLVSYAFAGVWDAPESNVVAPAKRSRHRPEVMRFHIPAVPHTRTSKTHLSCAFTQKIVNLSKILTEAGHECFHYGCEGSDLICTENVEIVSDEYRQSFYPDLHTQGAMFTYDTTDAYHRTFWDRAAVEIKKRLGGQDILCCPWGFGHKPIADALGKSVIAVESGIGYSETWASFKVFESYFWMAHVYGRQQQTNGTFMDRVINNYLDPADFDFEPEKDDYFLYLGRVIKRKGLELAVELTRQLGVKLVIAGQGSLVNEREGLNLRGDHIEFVGVADVEKRRQLLAKAKCLIAPTWYLEPWGGVVCEAQVSGTPVITTDWGGFTENVLPGITGYRCRTMSEFLWAGQHIDEIDPYACRDWAMKNYSLAAVGPQYIDYFRQLQTLWDDGWNATDVDVQGLRSYRKWYPSSAAGSDKGEA